MLYSLYHTTFHPPIVITLLYRTVTVLFVSIERYPLRLYSLFFFFVYFSSIMYLHNKRYGAGNTAGTAANDEGILHTARCGGCLSRLKGPVCLFAHCNGVHWLPASGNQSWPSWPAKGGDCPGRVLIPSQWTRST